MHNHLGRLPSGFGRPLVLLTLLLLGCPGQELPELTSGDACQKQADAAVAAAKTARQAKDPDQAELAAERAEDAARQAEGLIAPVDSTTQGEANKKQLRAVQRAARSARRQASATREEQELAEKLDGTFAKGYRKASGLAVAGVFKGLSLAANQAVGKDLDALDPKAKNAALMAADLAHELTGREKLKDGSPDWKGIAADMDALAAKPGPRTHLVLAVAFLIPPLKKDGFALYEVESIDPAELQTDEERAAYYTLRGIVYRMNDYPTLASEQLNLAADQGETVCGPELLAGINLLLASYYLKAKDYHQADIYITRSIRAWPDNPVAIYFTGEVQAANGEYDEAAESFEKAMQGSDGEWLAQRIADRAKDIRDGQSDDSALFHDAGFVREVVVHYVALAAERSEPAKRVQQTIDRATGFGERMMEELKSHLPKLPGSSG